MAEELSARFRQLHDRHRRPIAVVGWSLGGIYAWSLAQRFAEQVEAVVTLGSPLVRAGDLGAPSSVPLTSIWSRRDRVVNWRSSVITESDRRENIEVRALHVTLGFDPLVVGAIADRLAQRPDRWRPFRPPPWLTAAYPPTAAR